MEKGLLHHPNRGEEPGRPGDVPAEKDQKIGADQLEQMPAFGLVVDMQGLLPAQKIRGQQQGKGDDSAVPEAEGHIPPVGAVPDADDKIDQESGQGGGENFPQLALQMLPGELAQLAKGLGQGERVEEVVPHPGPQCDVPAPPEVGQGGGEQRAAEVLRQVDAEQPGHPTGDVNATGEIPV